MKVVQIGTNDGNDEVRNFCIKESPEFILLVEPFSIHNARIQNNYRDVKSSVYIENIAIHPTQNLQSITLFYSERDGPLAHPSQKYEVTSINPEHLLKHGYHKRELRSFKVPALTLNTLFEKYALRSLDYLFLDVEGIDFEVLSSIDFEKYDIEHIQIEHIHLDVEKLVKFMSEHGYIKAVHAIDTTGYDTLFKKSRVL